MAKKTKAKETTKPAQDEQQFQLQKIYLKDISFETPNSPEVFTENWEPDVNVELQTAGKPLADDVHEVVLTVTVTAKLGDKTAYLIEVHQAGVEKDDLPNRVVGSLTEGEHVDGHPDEDDREEDHAEQDHLVAQRLPPLLDQNDAKPMHRSPPSCPGTGPRARPSAH